MPMILQALVPMRAPARFGAIQPVLFGGFAAKDLATRSDDARPKVIVSASCGIEGQRVLPYKPLLDRAIELSSHKPEHCVIRQRPQAEATLVAGRDLTWDEAEDDAIPADCVPVKATDPAYILHTSGTTGQPQGGVRSTGGDRKSTRLTSSHSCATR